MGGGCCVTFEDCAFDHCCLVLVAGAEVYLRQPQFNFSDTLPQEAPDRNVAMLAAERGTRVVVEGGSITGGDAGVVVQAGAHLEASELAVLRTQRCGIEVTGEGSSSAALTDCSVVEAGSLGVSVGGGSAVCLERCTMSRCAYQGLEVRRPGSHARANCCNFLDNFGNGVVALEGSTVHAVACMSSGNGRGEDHLEIQGLPIAAYEARDAVVELTDCSSDADHCGCIASFEGKVMARNVTVTRSATAGFLALDGSRLELRGCSASRCEGSAVHAKNVMYTEHVRSMVDAEGCTFSSCREWAMRAEEGAVVEARRCSSVENGLGGYSCGDSAHLTVTDSSSMGDTRGYSSHTDGVLRMLRVSVDGVCKSSENVAAMEMLF